MKKTIVFESSYELSRNLVELCAKGWVITYALTIGGFYFVTIEQKPVGVSVK